MAKETLLIIPAYNEEMNIGTVLDDLREGGIMNMMDVVVINDGSGDKTAEVVKSRGVELINQCFNMGYGAALQTGYKFAADNDYQYVLQMDADGQHDVRNLERILRRLKGLDPASGNPAKHVNPDRLPDIIIGSRFLKGSETFKVSGLKIFAITGFCKVIKHSTGYNLTDPTSGLQGLNRDAFCYYARSGNFDIQYPDLNMIIQMLIHGYHIEEVPAIMHERTAGVSMHTGLYHAMMYMIVMTISTINVFNQGHRKK